MQRSFASFSLLLLSLIGGSSPFLRASSLYSLVPLGGLGTKLSGVTSLNSSGTSVGFYTDSTGVENAILFNGGTTTQLGSNAAAYAVNDLGTAVGSVYTNGNNAVAEWSGTKQISLGIAGYGLAINNGGLVVGGLVSAGQTHAFTYANGNTKDLGTLGGSWSTAYAVNNGGTVAGTSTLANGRFGAFVTNGNSLLSLGTLGGANSYATAISGNGFVAGSSQNRAGYLNAFVWTSAGMQDLGTLGGSISTAQGVNGTGSVVGTSTTAAGAYDGFLYTNGTMVDLNSFLPVGSGWTITGTSGINDAGQILATAVEGGQSWAVELDPTESKDILTSVIAAPEPQYILLEAVALFILIRAMRRRVPAGTSNQ